MRQTLNCLCSPGEIQKGKKLAFEVVGSVALRSPAKNVIQL